MPLPRARARLNAVSPPKRPPAQNAIAAQEAELCAALGEDALKQLIASLPDFVVVLYRNLRALLANRGIGRRSAEQLKNLHVSEFLPSHLHPVAIATMHRVLATGQIDGYAAQIEGQDGQSRHFDMRVSP